MSKKKIAQEELIKTHVLNLEEIREAERKERYSKHKKIPIVLTIMGLFLIIFGSFYTKFTSYFVKKDKVVVASKVEKNILTCISNIEDKNNNLKIYTKTVYTFNNNLLKASDSSMSISLLQGVDYTVLNNLKDKYNSIYVNTNNGIVYTINVSNNTLYFNSIINNYKYFDAVNYNPEINTVNHTTVFKGGENMNMIKNSEENLGNLCH